MPKGRPASDFRPRLAQYSSLRTRETSGVWYQVWEATRRAITTVTTTRAACHLLNVLLEVGALDSTINANSLEDSLFGGGNNGPSSLTDTSLILLTKILRSKFLDNERRFEAFCLKIIGWLNLRWTLRMTNLGATC